MRLLVILPRFPFPLEKGDKLRAYHQLRLLSESFRLFVVALHEEELRAEWLAQAAQFCDRLETIRLSRAEQAWELSKAVISGIPFQVAYFHSPSAMRKIAGWAGEWKPDALYCQLLRTAPYERAVPGVPRVLDLQDAFSAVAGRWIRTAPYYLKPVLWAEERRLKVFEERMVRHFDHCTIISEQDRDCLPAQLRDRVVVVRNGVRMEAFEPGAEKKDVEVLFVGNMGYAPNIEGATFLANRVMPLVWERMPDARLMLAGASPALAVQQLAGPRVTVTGWVDDMRGCYARAMVFAAPMTIGAGLQNKLLEAMAMGLPCITTDLANNAIGGRQGIHLELAETAQQFADTILSLLEDKGRAEQLGKAGHHFVRDHYGWEAQTAPLARIFQSFNPKQG